MRHLFVRLSFASLVAVAVAACHDSTGTGHFVEREYFLSSLGDQTLPYVWSATADGDTVSLLSDTFTLRLGGRATRTISWRVVENGGAPTITTESGEWRYSRMMGVITLSPVCPANANCTGGLSGTLSDEQLVLAPLGQGSGPKFVYARVSLRD